MRWRGGRRSSNIEDRRAARTSRGLPGLGGRTVRRGGGVGLVGIVIALGAAMLFGVDPGVVLQILGGGSPAGVQTERSLPRSTQINASPQEQALADFVSVVLADTEDTWNALFSAGGARYEEPRLVMFRGSVSSACGFASAAAGPFYCPGDRKVYLDLAFFEELERRFDAPGDFAQAYVIAHEVGHHVQTLLGISEQVHAARRGASRSEANAIQVRMELQADCLAGLWAHHAQRARNILEHGDVEEALNAANAIGDDTLQRQSQGVVVPDAFTHGSARQRMRWFRIGLEKGSVRDCNTFDAATL
ncbi:MAG: neutral zinc metallopeptidase [Gammaproteobacteria bacterium]|nr:neutral zinc metallopeptidase [Gammaproteobacteria bacterium]